MSESLYEKALRLLGRPIKKAADGDDADTRVTDEAQPSDKKLEAAGEEAAAGGQAGGEAGGVPANPGAGEGEGPGPDGSAEHEAGESAETEANEEEAGDNDEGQDMDADEVRELRKAFGLTDEDNVIDHMHSKEVASVLGQILTHMQKADAFMQSLTKELVDLKAKHASGKGDEELRLSMKGLVTAMDEKFQAFQKLLAEAPRTAPAAGGPKAVLKANPAQPEQRLSLSDVTQLAISGKISAAEAAKLTRQINHQTPA